MSIEKPHFDPRPKLEKIISCQSDQVRFFPYKVALPFSRLEEQTFTRAGFSVRISNHQEGADYLSLPGTPTMGEIAHQRLETMREDAVKNKKPKPKKDGHSQTPPIK